VRICVNIIFVYICVPCLFVFRLVFYAVFIFPHPLSFSLPVFENEMSEGDKTFLPARLLGLHVWEGVRAGGWKSLTSS
jgi:hypothetical protein